MAELFKGLKSQLD